ncbi:hypothetical protein GQ602_004731 [Ophiocordyceps camponoti-floridani]|uniref:Uncharacterized protein n=1 Tax=Ophiocordyceps camponoti-floridani TaxID=2030778 RepID=A0A8H4Q4F1_9HYPO|nr:hypothetical protein GQ602_004731 [Ophiocordyceps camponoti-floridani]
MDQSPLHPDFSEVSRSFEALSHQFARVGNLPVVDEGRRVLETLERVMARLDQIQQEQRQGFARFQSALDLLSRENAARDRNQHVAFENSALVQGDGQLKPLLSLSTGRVSSPFPSAVDDVNGLSSAETEIVDCLRN